MAVGHRSHDATAFLVRARLLEVLARRWTRRAICVTAGAGFGKTVLLEQAMVENRLGPRGQDLLLSCTAAHGLPSRFAASVADLVGLAVSPTLAPSDVIDAAVAELARRWTGDVCLVLDDAHHLGRGSAHRLLVRLIAAAPANVHFVVAWRRPPRGLFDSMAADDVEYVDEVDLRFDGAELAEFAERAGGDPQAWSRLGGWPALVALAARYGWRGTTEFVRDAVLAELDEESRLVLASLTAIGGGDADLLRAAMADPAVDSAAVLAGVPLLDWDDRGACVPHELWSDIIGGVLDRERQAAVQRRAGRHLLALGDYDRAFHLSAEAADWSGAALVLRDACSRGYAGVPVSILEGWLALWPYDRRNSAEGLLLRGLVRRAHDPFSARTSDLLCAAARAFREMGNVAGEVAASMELAYVCRVRGDLAALPELMMRAMELHDQGHREVDGAMALGRAVCAELSGDDERYVAELATVPHECLSVEWRAVVAFMEFTGYLSLGREEPMLQAAHRCAQLGGAGHTGRHAVAVAAWYSGRPELALRTLDEIRRDQRASRVDCLTLGSFATLVLATSGHLAEAKETLASAQAAGEGSAQPLMAGYVAGAAALVAVAAGDEAEAACILRRFLGDHPLSSPIGRRAATRWLTLAYVLLPETRSTLDDTRWGPLHERTLAGARTLVALREGKRAALHDECLPSVVTSMPLPWSLGLASAVAETGDPRGRRLAESLFELHGENARVALRSLAAAGRSFAAPGAKKLLAEVPLAPSNVELRVLGPAELLVDGHPTRDPHWRRDRVRALLLYLVCRGHARREEVIEALWPDAPLDAAGRNLRVTLSYLNRVLEPDRRAGEAPFLLKQCGEVLVIAGPPHLRLDLVDLEALLDEADDADRRGVPSLARDAFERALPLWRGPCLNDVAYEDWAQETVRRLERRFIAAAVRAAELALACGAPQDACRYAEQALRVDEWCEAAHRVLVNARLDAGDRLGAARALARCDEMLASLGVLAHDRTEEIRHRLRPAAIR